MLVRVFVIMFLVFIKVKLLLAVVDDFNLDLLFGGWLGLSRVLILHLSFVMIILLFGL